MEWVISAYKCSNPNKNKFILLFQDRHCPYEYMDDWEKSNKALLPEKEDFYSHLNN